MGNLSSIIILVGFLALIYFMMIRPQKKKEKEDQAMRDALMVGDEILTIGGVIGKVVKITEKSVIITTGADKTKVEFIKTAIASVNRGAGAKPQAKKESQDTELENGPEKEKKVTPKKLAKKSSAEEASEEK